MENNPILNMLFLGSAGAMTFAALTFFSISFITTTKSSMFRIFAAISLIGGFYQWTTLNYMNSLTITEATFWFKMQSLSKAVFAPMFTAFVNLMSKYDKAKLMNNIVVGLYSIFFLLKFSMPNGMRYTFIEGHKTVDLPWGETIHLLHGPSHVLYLLMLPISLFLVCWGVWRGIVMMKTHPGKVGWIFTLVNFGFILSAVYGVLINKGVINSFYIAGFNIFLFIMTMAIEISREAHEYRLKLQSAIKDKEEVEQTLVKISTSIQHNSDQPYLDQMAQRIQEILPVQMSQILLFDENQKILQIVNCRNARILDASPFELIESPYLSNIQGVAVEIFHGLRKKYPKNTFFHHNHVEGLISIPLIDDNEHVYGVISVLDTHPLKNSQFFLRSLRIFAAQISSELKAQQAQADLHALAYVDYLTQLYNRAKLHDDLESVFDRSVSGKYNTTLYHLDLDGFKDINEFLGSEMADHLLIRLAQRFKELTSIRFKAYRLTADEFIFILEHSQSDTDSIDFANKLHQTVSNPFVIGDHQINVNCSIGLVHFPSQAKHLNNVLNFAETALSEAKASEDITTKVFDPEVQKSLNFKEEMEEEIRQAINIGQFELYFQPQIDADERPFGAEVLVRWNHPERGFISPGIFIPIAEETGLIHPLGEWILENSIKQAHQWYTSESTVPPHISINVSAWQFGQDNFVAQVRSYLKKYPVPTSWIVLELTETAIINDINVTKEKIVQLRAMGLSIALDDFGTGYSSLAYVKDLPFDYIKIDKAFVDQMFEEGGSGIVETIISMGKHMNLKIIAEGTETNEQILQLKSFGCKLFQGFFYSKPVSIREYETFVSQKM